MGNPVGFIRAVKTLVELDRNVIKRLKGDITEMPRLIALAESGGDQTNPLKVSAVPENSHCSAKHQWCWELYGG